MFCNYIKFVEPFAYGFKNGQSLIITITIPRKDKVAKKRKCCHLPLPQLLSSAINFNSVLHCPCLGSKPGVPKCFASSSASRRRHCSCSLGRHTILFLFIGRLYPIYLHKGISNTWNKESLCTAVQTKTSLRHSRSAWRRRGARLTGCRATAAAGRRSLWRRARTPPAARRRGGCPRPCRAWARPSRAR